MSFLQPMMLIGLPLITLPIIIHLINQRRFQTVPWAAMQFLLAAKGMARGYARLRQWLILAARTLAIAGLIFAISRPLSSGWLGLAGGGRVDTTIILLDRSPSMAQRGPGGVSKLQAGVQQLMQSLGVLRSSRYVLIDSVGLKAIEIESPNVLADLPEAQPVSQSADVPAMLEVADQYIRANRPSRCEVWICSDVRRHDWKDESGRWEALRSSILELPQMVRFHLLAYPGVEAGNRSLTVTDTRRIEDADEARLLLSLRIEQDDAPAGTTRIPIRLELDGARSEFTAEMTGSEFEIQDYVVPMDRGKSRGWGRVSIPSDASPADNEYFFVYDREVERRTVIVADDPDRVRALELAASISPDPNIACSTQTITPDRLIGTPLESVALVLWQSNLPDQDDGVLAIVKDFVSRGGRILFMPPESPGAGQFAGIQWGHWQQNPVGTAVTTWVSDQDLLSHTRSGAALPVGQLTVARFCELLGDRTSLATLDGGSVLLARAMTDRRNVYFLATTTSQSDSSLARDGVVLYAMIQRALEAGADSLGNTRHFIAGDVPFVDTSGWRQLAGNRRALSSAFDVHAGVYQQGEQLFAVNRSAGEDAAAIVSRERMDGLFDQLEFDRVDDQIGSGTRLIQEIWRLFLVAMLLALTLEAALCIPKRPVQVATKQSTRVAA